MLALLLLAGCQARLDLSGVQAQQSQAIQRADLLQAVAQHKGMIVTVGAMGVVITSEDGGTSWQRTTVARMPDRAVQADYPTCSCVDKMCGL